MDGLRVLRDAVGTLGIPAALLAVLAGAAVAGMAVPAAAFAADGTVTVEALEGNVCDTFSVYQVFTADISDEDAATHVAWNRDARDAVLAFLDSNGYVDWLDSLGYDAPGARGNAQNAAEFIAEQIGASAADEGASTRPETKQAGSFATRLAQALERGGLQADTAAVGRPYTNAEGYYLIVTDPASVREDGAATAPIWIALGGSLGSIAEKSALPTVDKGVKGSGAPDLSHATDAFTGQDIDYRLVATAPSNIGAFAAYHLGFTDVLSGMDLEGSGTSSVTVRVGDVDVTGQLAGETGSITYRAGVLSIDIANLLALAGVSIDKDTRVIVDYRAHNTAEAGGSAGDGGTNTVSLTYTADPVSGADTTTDTTSKQVKAYSYRISAQVVDKSNGKRLAGARFTVQLAAYDGDEALSGRYVQADGSLGDGAWEFESGADGIFEVGGLDAGTYVIAQVAAPEGYEPQDADMTVAIAADVDGATAELADLRADLAGGEAADVAGDEATRVTGIDKQTGTVSLLVANDRTFTLAQTGLEGLAAHAAVAAALAAAGIAGVLAATRSGKRRGQ